MSEPPGVPSALGIEAVEWLADDSDSLTVWVTGRWRRRRGAWGGQPLLVIEAEGTRHRFPAMPEPPSLTGAAPGTWRLSFSVPASLAPHLGGRIWLQFGAVVAPLPPPGGPSAGAERLADPAAGPPSASPELDPDTLTQRRLRSSELALDGARRRVTEAEGRAAELQAGVEQLRQALSSAEQRLADGERARRVADQRAHAEQALRLELEEQLDELDVAEQTAADALQRLARSEERVRQLEAELEQLRRRPPVAAKVAVRTAAQQQRELAAEMMVARRTRSPEPPITITHGRGLGVPRGLRAEQRMIAARSPATARSPMGPGSESRMLSTLSQIRAELQALPGVIERERAARDEAEQRAATLERELHDRAARADRAYQAIEQLREELEAVRVATRRAESAGSPVEPERLEAALSRLRESTPPLPPAREPAAEQPGAPAPAATTPEETATVSADQTSAVAPWLARVFSTLAERDAGAAGRLLLQLLPVQGTVAPESLAYDLILGELACVQVTVSGGVSGGSTRVGFEDFPRDRGKVQFQLTGELAAIARFLVAGRMRRRFGRGMPKLTGSRQRVSALRALVRARLTLQQLHEAGMRLDPALALTVLSLMIDPALTSGERFTIAHQETGARVPGAYLEVGDGAPLTVSEARPQRPVAVTVIAPGHSLLPVLAGERPAGLLLSGDERPLALLAQWLEAAQSA